MDGFVNVLKPSGPTASDVVVKLKKVYSQKKIGHLGTLDPGAAGVLPIALGKATKLFDLLTYKTKKYRVYFTFGKTTDTLDSYGQVTDTKEFLFTQEQLQNAIKSFVGKIEQLPPMYSAISINGNRAYDLARQGIDVQLPLRQVEVFDFKLVRQVSNDTWCFDILCGGGTYMRSLARDLAHKLDTVGYMSCLIRLSSGPFDVLNAKTLEEICQNPTDALLDLEYPLLGYDKIEVPKKYYKQLYNGVKLSGLDYLATNISDIVYYRVYCDNKFFGVGSFKDSKLVLDYRMID